MNNNTLGKLIIGSIITIASIAVCNAQEFNAPSRPPEAKTIWGEVEP